MGELSKIEWTDHTFNPWEGCAKVSAGCKFCYAEARNHRFGGGLWGKDAERRRTSKQNWKKPLKWNKEAAAEGERKRVFCASLADVFEDQADVNGWREELWEMIRATPWLDWQLLTKRPENIERMLPEDWGFGYANVWLGTSLENFETSGRMFTLMKVPAKVRFLSMEPLLEFVNIGTAFYNSYYVYPWIHGKEIKELLHWVIIGGESGKSARRFEPGWAAGLVEICRLAEIPVFMKQLGSYQAKRQGLSDKKGGNWDEWAAELDGLKVREFPKELEKEKIIIRAPKGFGIIPLDGPAYFKG